MIQKHFPFILPRAFWNPGRGVKIIVFPEKWSIFFKKKASAYHFKESCHAHLIQMSAKWMLPTHLAYGRHAGLWKKFFFFFFASNPHVTYRGEHRVLLYMLRVTLGVAQIFQALWTEFFFLLNFTVPLCFAFQASHSFSALGCPIGHRPIGHRPDVLLPRSLPGPRLGRQQAPPEGLKQQRKCLHRSGKNVKWNFRHCSQKHFACSQYWEVLGGEPTSSAALISVPLPSPGVLLSPNSHLPVYHSDRLCASLFVLPPNFPMHSCHAEGPLFLRGILFSPVKLARLLCATHAETIKPYPWRGALCKESAGCLGDTHGDRDCQATLG